MIVDKYPEQYKLAFALWTTKAVKELIEQQFGVILARSTMSNYLRSWGFTPQKPKKKPKGRIPFLIIFLTKSNKKCNNLKVLLHCEILIIY